MPYRQPLTPVHDDALRRRLWGVGLIIVIGFSLLLARVWHLQVMQGEYFLNLSEQNRIRNRRIKSLRGKILDRYGRILATNRPAYAVMAMPEDLPPMDLLRGALQRLEMVTEGATLQMLQAKTTLQPVLLKRDVPRDRVAYFTEHRMDFPGLFLDVEPLRSYPYGPLAAHLLGYLGKISEAQMQRSEPGLYQPGALIGQYGLERRYEAVLRGTHGIRQVEVDTFGRETQQLAIQPPTSGTNLVLTLDFTLQDAAEKLLEEHTGSIVALDPRNGQILALASRPAFDPNRFASHLSAQEWTRLTTDRKRPLHNRVIQGQYPPGSIFKIVTALGVLEEGIATPRTTVCCTGKHIYGRRTYHDWKRTGHGCVTVYEALVQSCDVFFYHMGQELGVDRLAHYSRIFGLGRQTGFAPALEQQGLVPSTQWKRRARGEPWYGGETLSVAIGQGYTLTTPLQVANVMATVANGGTLYQPYVVLRQEREDGTVVGENHPTVIRQLNLQSQHLELVRRGLWGVVHEPRGTGQRARHDHIAIAGKTATVQVVSLAKGGRGHASQARLPEHQRDHAWFAAFAPMEAPRIIVVIMIEHAGKGGSNFAGYAKTLIQTHLQHSLVSASTSDAVPPP